ncbi:HPr kinase/phosphatase C-terminal domain-containing protein [Cereibacter azotoformans]|uniref:Hpr(Ser) kinase/phosphatase n=1 Tax=Cereibacter azotoformans TaxID=43057 RepID=A0A2T5K7A5_9RHOB|nr:HPr kinase/phosphatase C-terminal domain-containing protein [Cereibacter azotoformans]AXQ94433.1 serine kinase [Cereibacter sphaeroides]MBO4170734.1 HPr kinase/phosphatase C-terminal domain-containing protein [Cereibacter azotoformans]PTR18307.1 Hpr(Ser) kinase/phosphatase [Cereibacter azotoformans]UIJ29975.1 HPr kinase/phosphatase C-terminal domain-containing protein [Cereibacter azotoformans]
MSGQGRTILHASCVALDGRALLILGPSGAGKSSLALEMIGLGARLVADDRTELERQGEALIARSPPALAGLIEARGLGILRAPFIHEARVALAVDMGRRETERLPQIHNIQVLGVPLDLVLGQEGSHFSSALLLRLRSGRVA